MKPRLDLFAQKAQRVDDAVMRNEAAGVSGLGDETSGEGIAELLRGSGGSLAAISRISRSFAGIGLGDERYAFVPFFFLEFPSAISRLRPTLWRRRPAITSGRESGDVVDLGAQSACHWFRFG